MAVAESAAAVVGFESGDDSVEVAVTLQLRSRSDSSQHQRLFLFPLLWVWGGVQELRAANEKTDPVPQTDCVTHLRPEPVASIRSSHLYLH